jgi:hypothetical protein
MSLSRSDEAAHHCASGSVIMRRPADGDVAAGEVGVMDNDEALRLLKGGEEGVREWNRRRAAVEEIPDFAGANPKPSVIYRASVSKAR